MSIAIYGASDVPAIWQAQLMMVFGSDSLFREVQTVEKVATIVKSFPRALILTPLDKSKLATLPQLYGVAPRLMSIEEAIAHLQSRGFYGNAAVFPVTDHAR